MSAFNSPLLLLFRWITALWDSILNIYRVVFHREGNSHIPHFLQTQLDNWEGEYPAPAANTGRPCITSKYVARLDSESLLQKHVMKFQNLNQSAGTKLRL